MISYYNSYFIKLNSEKNIEKKNVENILNQDRQNYRKEFLGNVAHELKTPLFSIQGFLLTLIDGAIDDPNVKYKYLHRIHKSLDRLLFLINDLDLLFDLEAKNFKLNLKSFNINSLIEEIIDSLEDKAKKYDVKIIFKKNKISDLVTADQKRISQVLINLLVNSIVYSGKESIINISLESKQKKLYISIKDNGIGIKQKDLERIFERFYRVDDHRNRDNGGSGLGLSIVKNIILAHNQKIQVFSKFGYGTEFVFSLNKDFF